MTLWTTEEHAGVQVGFRTDRTLYHAQSPYQAIDVVETQPYGRMLLLDGLVMTTERDEFVYHEMIAHVPLLNHPDPKRVLIIGGGDGGTVREALKHPEVETIVLCEIDGMVVEACKTYLPALTCGLSDPRVTVNIGDGIAYMAEEARDFDVIIIDSSDPVGPGEGLFTEDFYCNVHRALKGNGLMVAQTESPYMDHAIIQKIYPMFQRIFPLVRMYTGAIPTYPSGFWSWGLCAKTNTLLQPADNPERLAAIEKTCRYYNGAIHQASFALPNFVKQLLNTPVAVG